MDDDRRGMRCGGPVLKNLQEEERMTHSQNESDSGYSITSGSPNSHEGILDTEAGPDIGDMDQFTEEEFRPATEVFSGQDLDFLNQHGSGSSTVSHLARQSLYVKFDPLIGGRPSVLGRPSVAPLRTRENEDLIAMNSPSPAKPLKRTEQNTLSETNAESDTSGNETVLTKEDREEMTARELNYIQTQMQKDHRYIELEKELTRARQKMEVLREELKVRIESEEQMKQVLEEYEKTISELIADNKAEKTKLEEELKKIQEEKDQATEDLLEELKKIQEEKDQEELKKIQEEKDQDAEIAKLTARLRKAEMQATRLEREVDMKAKENQELTNICDELISKVGS
ncbi:transforming acidic coiled-coil-containing protein 3 [Eurytemora carolleeae]|uniref:transforming acidic coiled-coil-containing protein 3 n=1 Tax=Eurytemora carolleeae TaxID=1294199 RepID=UPI000C77C805|nr:transforming acidic coiled-coil-containing protein 3 [Eurytemora carolleeae]|eukprot:XP_023340175.1 transforming acidic coiled-coil-containing protein 3-like [Eurytemora affinis]